MAPPNPSRLLDQVREVARLKHFSLATEKSYVYYIRDFILFHNKRHPKDMGAPEIRAYLSHLVIQRNVAASTQTVALSALLFLYRQVLDIELPYIEDIERAKRPQRLPVVFLYAFRSKAHSCEPRWYPTSDSQFALRYRNALDRRVALTREGFRF